LSDLLNPVPVTHDDLSYLVNLGAPLLELAPHRNKPVVRALGAIAYLGVVLPQLADNAQLEHFLERHRTGATKAAAPSPADVDEALKWLADAVNAGRPHVENQSLAGILKDEPELTFESLRARLAAR
jgi:hypothetical protein